MEKLKEVFKILNDNLAVIILLGGGVVQISKFLITTHFERKKIFFNENMMIEIEGLKNFKELYYDFVEESETVHWEIRSINKEDWNQMTKFDNNVESLRKKYVGLSVNMKKIETLLSNRMIIHFAKIEMYCLSLVHISDAFSQYAKRFWNGGDMSDLSSEIHRILIIEDDDLKSFAITKWAFLKAYEKSQNEVFDSGSKLFDKLNKKSKSWF